MHWLLDRDEPVRRLDARTVVERAHELVHEGGEGSLSMRSLASALGTSTSAVYRHVPSKRWLLIAIVDIVLSEVRTEPAFDRNADARGRLEALSSSYRNVLRRHPHLHGILASEVALTPNSIRIAEAVLTCLRDQGVGDGDLVHAYNAWCGYVIGFSVLETRPPDPSPDPELQHAMRDLLKGTDADAAPIVAEMMDEVAGRAYGLRWRGDRLGNGQASFAWGLAALLDGYEDRAAAKKGRSRSGATTRGA